MKLKWKNILAAALSLALALSACAATVYADTNEEEQFSISFSRVADLTVYVDGKADGDLSQDNVVCGEVVRLTAPQVGGKNFSHWAFGSENGAVASTRAKYNFTLNGNTTVYAVYKNSAHEEKTCIAISSAIKEERMDNEYIRMTASYSLPDSVADINPATDWPITEGHIKGEIGIRYTTDRMLGSDGSRDLLANPVSGIDVETILKSENPGNSVRVSSYKFCYAMGDWTLGIKNPGNSVHVYAVAYITYNGQTVFSDVKSLVYGNLGFDSKLSANVSDPFTLGMPDADAIDTSNIDNNYIRND